LYALVAAVRGQVVLEDLAGEEMDSLTLPQQFSRPPAPPIRAVAAAVAIHLPLVAVAAES
jgi:hypothetical protein